MSTSRFQTDEGDRSSDDKLQKIAQSVTERIDVADACFGGTVVIDLDGLSTMRPAVEEEWSLGPAYTSAFGETV
ncbi:hypothetical protein N2599_30070 (plasmid) [Rhizobium sullae]|uniref:Uncharacterized protein n=1 Tax=Rhizobium sullae TaxID=50338 RepID=A0A2N0DCJ7_RHISU|nr:hypothetical protein [Rhizobium sullae]PKA43814.1 hypothetical protein CWR43_09315 [Rhizobium sullae]UWU17048.1 hypothetical protein N2599_30070 [Rhizobium sullae]